jgi:DHA2 family metal-tetracycline-proton antiporter-like MFS transporter
MIIAISGLMLLIVTDWWPGAILTGLSSLLLILHLRRTPWPFIPWRLLGNRTYQLALATTFLAIGTVFGMFFVVPLMLRDLFSLSTIEIGLTIFPGAFCAALMGFRAGALADRVGSKRVVRYGLVAMMSGYALLTLSPMTSALATTLFLIPAYSGFAFIHAALAKTVSLTLPTEETGVGMGLYNLVFFLSGAFGIALVSRILERLSGQATNVFKPENLKFSYSCTFCLSLVTVLIAHWLFRHIPNNHPD